MGLTLTKPEIGFLGQFIVESDAIEGIKRTREEVAIQLNGGYAKGHVGAYHHLLSAHENGEMLSSQMIRDIQSLIVAEQSAYGERALRGEWIGRWRNIGVSAGGRMCPPPSAIPEKMKHLVGAVRAWQKHRWTMITAEESVRFIAGIHFAYEHAHPFVDGNGRSGRALVYLLYRHAHLVPFVFTAVDRHETYYRCFENPNDMVEYFLARTTFPAPLQ